MKRTLTFLMTALFLCMGMTMKAQTFPETSTAEAPKYYTIASFNRGGFLTNVGNGKGVEHVATAKGSIWYFTKADDNGGLHFCNFAGGYLAADKTVSETAGVWYVLANGVNTDGVSISSTNPISGGSCIDANNYNTGVGAWHPSASDWHGTTWVFAEVTDFSVIFNVDEAKAAAKAEIDVLASETAIYPDAAAAKASIDAIQPEGTSAAQLTAAIDAVNQCVVDYKNAAYEALEGKYFTFSTPARSNGFMKLDGNRVIGLAEASSPAAVWQFVYADNAVKVFNPYTGKYLGEPGGNSADVPVAANAEDAAAYQLVINDKAEKAEAKVKFTSNGKSVHMAGGSVLVRWDNGGASEWTVAEISEFSGIVSLHKAAAVAAVDAYSALPEIFETAAAKEAINAVSATDWSAFAAVDEAANKAIPTGTFAFQATSGDNHRDSVWVSANMETSKAIGAVEQDENAHWTLKPANGGAFYIYNVKNGLYMGNPGGNCALTESPVAAYTVEVIDAEKNVVEFKCSGQTLHASNHDDDKLMNYDGDEAASRWTIVAIVEEPEVDPNDYTSAIANADLSTGDAWNTEGTKGISGGMVKVASESAFDFSQTITLPAGQYKMTAKAVYRYTGSEAEEFAAIEAGTKTRLVNLYAETATCKYEADVMNRYDGASDTDYAAGNGSVTVNGKFVPNSSSAVQAWFNNGQYVNELVFNVQEEGQVKIGLTRTGSISGDYTNIGAWTLTRLGDAEADPNDYTSAIANADLSTGEAWNTEGTKGISGGMVKVASESAFDFNQTITLPAGQYKMTAKAAYRYAGSEADEFAAIEAGTKTRLVNLYAETATYKYEAGVMNRYDGASDTDYAAGNGSVSVNGKFVPNSSAAVQAWFDNGQYVNELVFNVQEEGQVKIGLTRTGSISGDYTNIGAWTLTRLGDAEADPKEEEPTPDPDPTPDPEEPEETVDLDMTHKVSRDWEGKSGNVTIDGIAMSEKYEGNADPVGDQLWQTVTGLENGKYTVKLWANARVAWVSSPSTDGQEELTYIFANNVEKSIAVLHNPGTNGNVLRTLEGVEVTDGTLRMGMTKKAAGSNWHSIQIESLTLHATNEVIANIAKVDLKAALDAANAVSPITDEFAAAIAAAQNVYDNSTDAEEVKAAVTSLKEATKLAILMNATEENPVLTDFVINGTFDAGTTGWKSTTGAQNQGTATNQQGAFTGAFFENWNGGNYTGKLYQVIENIPNGVYELSICAFVETFDGSAQFVYANADKVALTTGAPTAYTVRTIVKNNTIEVGFEQTVAVNRWCGIDNVSLTYFGEASDEESLNAAKVAFTAAYEEFGAALTACQAMMLKMSFYEIDDAAYQLNEQLETTTDVDALNAMAETLAEVTASLKEINEVYADYDVFVQKFKAAAEISEPKTTEAAELLEFNMYGGAGMQATSLEVLAQAVETIKADYFTYIANANLLDGNMFDLTYLIQNPNIDHNLDGWTLTGRVGRLNNNGFNGVPGIMEIGEWGATSWEAGVSQNLNELPNGKYIVKMAWMAASGIKMNLSANEASVEVTGIGDQGGNIAADGSVVEMGQGVQGWQYAEVEVFVEDGTLAIAVNSSSPAQYQWSNADAFELYYAGVPAPVEPEYLTVVGAKVGDVALVEGTATVESISTIDVIFDRPVAKAEDAGWATLADSWGPTNLDVEVLEAEEGSSEYVVRFTVSQEFNGEFTEAGEYALNIPEGFLVGAEDANYINAAIEAVITIEAAPVTPLSVTNVTVGEEVMEGFTAVATTEDMIKVNFDGQFYFQGMPVIVDAEGKDASEHFEYMNGLDVDGSNSYIFMGKTVGIYTITLPKASFLQMMQWKAPAEDIVLTVEITFPIGIQNVNVDADAVIYDIHGRRVTEMTKGLYIVNGKKVIVK